MYIKQSEIERLAKDSQRNYQVGLSYINRYDDTHIESLEIELNETVYSIQAEFRNNYSTNSISIDITTDGIIKGFSCDCPFQIWDTPCGHIFYVLHILQNTDTEILIAQNEQKKQYALELHNQFLVRNSKQFLNDYLNQSSNDWYAKITPVKYHLYATIEEEYEHFSVSFKIGDEKMYVIKNIGDFIQAFKNHATIKYGQKLKPNPLYEVFDEDSQKIIDFIKQIRVQQFSVDNYYYYRNNNRTLLIDEASLDLFYETFARMSPKYHDAHFASSELVHIPFTCEKEKGHLYAFSSPLLSSKLLLSDQYIYVQLDNTIYRYQKETSTHLLPIIAKLKEDGALYFTEDLLEEFYFTLIEPNKAYMDIDCTMFEKIAYKDVSLKIYIELNRKEEITLDVTYTDHQGNEQPLFQNNLKPTIETSKAYQLISLFKALNIEDTTTTKNRFICNKNIEEFTKLTLPHLQAMGEVFVSDELLYREKKTHYGFTTGVKVEGNLLKLAISSIAISQEEVLQVLREYRRKKKFFKLKNGEVLNLESEELEQMSSMLEDLNLTDSKLNGNELTLPTYRAYTLDEIAKSNQEMKVERSENFEVLLSKLTKPQDIYDIPLPFAGILRDYQKEGYTWLKRMEHYGFGCILADDMGLGKTIQVLALLESSKQAHRTSIVVCPASLILNWQDEVLKFSKLSCLCIHGNSATRASLIEECMDYDIVITSYDFIRRDYELYQDKHFYYAILDEAQYIKNQTTKNAQSVKEIVSEHKLALSGTPIENSLAELWSIFDFLMPSYLYNYHFFKTHYETPIVRFNDEAVSNKLKKMVAPFILRRHKNEVLKELPEKTESYLMLEFNEEEQRLYEANLAQINLELAQKLGTEQYFDKMLILAMMTRLRQLCCDASLVYENLKEPSTKIQGCMELIENAYESGKPILLFSSFTSILKILEKELKKRQIHYLKLTGETAKQERHDLVEQFQKGDVPVFLISLKAGGTGLNLTAAEIVIHFDPWWNQSAQNQATDRAYRFGQKHNVQVYKLIMKDSIEEKIMKLQQSKLALANAFVENSDVSIASMSQEDLMSLFK